MCLRRAFQHCELILQKEVKIVRKKKWKNFSETEKSRLEQAILWE